MSLRTTRNTKWDYDAMQRVRREGADPCIILNISFSLDGFYIEAHRRLASYRLKAFHVFEPRRTRQKKNTKKNKNHTQLTQTHEKSLEWFGQVSKGKTAVIINKRNCSKYVEGGRKNLDLNNNNN